MLAAALRWPLRLVPKGAVVPVLSGPLRGAKWIVGAHTHGCWLGTYERATTAALLPFLTPDAVFYDLGANVGYFTLLAARRGCRVVAVEPLPRNLGLLRRHLELNGARATVVEAAVSDVEGIAYLAGERAQAQLSNAGLRVRTTTLTKLADAYGAPAVIKCDVEGAEDRALAVIPGRPVIVLSLHGTAGRAAERTLRRHGYTVHPVGDDLLVAHPTAGTPGR